MITIENRRKNTCLKVMSNYHSDVGKRRVIRVIRLGPGRAIGKGGREEGLVQREYTVNQGHSYLLLLPD